MSWRAPRPRRHRPRARARDRSERRRRGAFDAHGSAKQVYATGLAPGAQAALLKPGGRTVKTKRADGLGGLIFRKVKPGAGYRVRVDGSGEQSEPLTVLSKRSAPPSTDVYGQSIPSSGYGYLTTRDGTQLAINVHPPQNVASAGAAPAPGSCPRAAAAGPPPRRPR